MKPVTPGISCELMRKQGIACIGEMKNVLLEFSDMSLNDQYMATMLLKRFFVVLFNAYSLKSTKS